MSRLSPQKIDQLIGACTFHEAKAYQIHAIAHTAATDHGGDLPRDEEVLLFLGGVEPKCVKLVLGIACGHSAIAVDIHVHRVTNRWGYVQAPTPEKTIAVLQERLPREYWVEINAQLVPIGKHVCTGTSPK